MTLSSISILFGYNVSHCGIDGDVIQACKFVEAGVGCSYMACANPHSLVVAKRDQLFSDALHQADILIPDGAGIILAAKVLGLPINQRVAGSEFFLGLSERLSSNGGARYFFLGSSDHVLSLLRQRLEREFPRITVCGTLSPPYKPKFSAEENSAMVAAINAAQPDVLWVGMTAPKQEKWIYENRSKLEVPFSAAIGAVFDFYAGTKKRSSIFWCRLGLEWLPRFLKEPKRLWERNLKSTPIFLWWILREKIRQVLNRRST